MRAIHSRALPRFLLVVNDTFVVPVTPRARSGRYDTHLRVVQSSGDIGVNM